MRGGRFHVGLECAPAVAQLLVCGCIQGSKGWCILLAQGMASWIAQGSSYTVLTILVLAASLRMAPGVG